MQNALDTCSAFPRLGDGPRWLLLPSAPPACGVLPLTRPEGRVSALPWLPPLPSSPGEGKASGREVVYLGICSASRCCQTFAETLLSTRQMRTPLSSAPCRAPAPGCPHPADAFSEPSRFAAVLFLPAVPTPGQVFRSPGVAGWIQSPCVACPQACSSPLRELLLSLVPLPPAPLRLSML